MIIETFAIIAAFASGAVFFKTSEVKLQQIKDWWNSHTEEDKEKLETFLKIYQSHLARFRKEDVGQDQLDFNGVEISFTSVTYPIDVKELREFQIEEKIAALCRYQKEFVEKRYKDTPENLVLEEFKLWLQKISKISITDFNQDFIDELDARNLVLNKITQLTWKAGFLDVLTDLLVYTNNILKKVREEVSRHQARIVLNELVRKNADFFNCSMQFLYRAIEDESLVKKIKEFSVEGLLRQRESLRGDFFGGLILCVLDADETRELYNISEQKIISGLPDMQGDNYKKDFRDFAEQFCKFVHFCNIFEQLKNMEGRGGSIVVSWCLNDNNGIKNVNRAFSELKQEIHKTLDSISTSYKKAISDLENKIKKLKNKCCFCGWLFNLPQVKLLETKLKILRANLLQIKRASIELKTKLDGINKSWIDLTTNSPNLPEAEVKRLQESAHALTKSVSQFVSGILGIEYPFNTEGEHLLASNPNARDDVSNAGDAVSIVPVVSGPVRGNGSRRRHNSRSLT